MHTLFPLRLFALAVGLTLLLGAGPPHVDHTLKNRQKHIAVVNLNILIII